MENNVYRLTPFSELDDTEIGQRDFDDYQLRTYQKQFAMTNEEVDQVLRVLGDMGQEAVGSMGDDTPMLPSYHQESGSSPIISARNSLRSLTRRSIR